MVNIYYFIAMRNETKTLRIQSTLLAFAAYTHSRCDRYTCVWSYMCGILFGRVHSSSCYFVSSRPTQSYPHTHTYKYHRDSVNLFHCRDGKYLKFIFYCVCFVADFNTSFCSFEFGFCLLLIRPLSISVRIAPHNMALNPHISPPMHVYVCTWTAE